MASEFTLDDITVADADKPPIITIYGGHGVGKTTFGASAPSPIFLKTEDGLGKIRARAFPLVKSYTDMLKAIGTLYNGGHTLQTLVVDSLDHLEPLVWKHTSEINGWPNIEHEKYGKGYAAALDVWRELFAGFADLRDDRGMTIVLIAHCKIKRFESPETEAYDRYMPKLNEGASALVQELCDCVLFASEKVMTVSTDKGFGKKATRGVGGEERVLYTAKRPAFLAKNRYDMPPELPLSWEAVASFIPALAPPAAEVAA